MLGWVGISAAYTLKRNELNLQREVRGELSTLIYPEVHRLDIQVGLKDKVTVARKDLFELVQQASWHPIERLSDVEKNVPAQRKSKWCW